MSSFTIAMLAQGMELRAGSCGWIRLTVLEVNTNDQPHWVRVGWTDKHGKPREWKVADDVRTYERTLEQIEADAIAASTSAPLE